MPWTRVRLMALGGPEGLVLETVDALPRPGPGEVRLRVCVTSAAFTDVMIRKGLYPEVREKPPLTPGYDLVGIVDATGPGATRFQPGARVAEMTVLGAQAQYLCLPEHGLTPVPEGVSDVDALGMILSTVTPWQMLHRVAGLTEGQSLLIHGAGGAVGTAMLQLARAAGIAAFGTDVTAKHDLIRSLGATPLPADAPGPALRAATGGGVDAVFDPLGGASLLRSRQALKRGGMLIAFGFQNAVLGRGGSIPLDFLRLKLWNWLPGGPATAFYSIGAMRRAHPDWFRQDLEALLAMLAEGRVKPVVAEVLPMAQVRAAHARLEAGDVVGKLVLRVSEP